MQAPALMLACLVALVLALLVHLALSARRAARESFVSGPTRAQRAVELISRGATYSDFKLALQEGADPVTFADLGRLFSLGQLTPAAAERVLGGADAQAG